jgi:TRAP-type C4-dicarboxylate transport system permease small subunit
MAARNPASLLFAAIGRIEEVCLAGGILLIAGLTIANVIARTATGNSLVYAEELSQFAMIAVTFIGASYAASRGRHIRMTAIYDNLSEARQKALMLAITATTAALLAVLTYYSIAYAMTVRALGTISPALQVQFWIVYLAAPIGLGLGAVQYALAFYRNLTSDGVWLSYDQPDEYEELDASGSAL